MTKKNYFLKLRAAMVTRAASDSLSMAETLRACRLKDAGFSPASAASLIISERPPVAPLALVSSQVSP